MYECCDSKPSQDIYLTNLANAMKRAIPILTYIFLVIILVYLFNLLIYPIPFEIRSKGLDIVIDFLLPLSTAGLSIMLLIKQISKKNTLRYILATLGIVGLIISLLIILLIGFMSSAIYEDEHITFQSLDNKNDRIIMQFMDEGAFGAHRREVRVKDLCCGIRYSNRFCETTLNGLWIKYDYLSGHADTLRFGNHIYKSELNGRQNWTTKKCK